MARARAGERGYTLVAVAVIVTVLSIAVAMVLPAWSAQIQRDREEELVFRGLQYAEAIRVFQRRFGRFPNTLSELVAVKPRSIRQLWADPITENGIWQTIPLAPPAGEQGGTADGRLPPGGDDADGDDADGDNLPDADTPAAGAPAGPIIGVRSSSGKTGFRTFFGQDAYSQWRFTYDLVTPGGGGGAQMEGVGVPVAPGPGGIPRVPRAEWIGRPLPGVSGPPTIPGQLPGQPPAKGGDEEQ